MNIFFRISCLNSPHKISDKAIRDMRLSLAARGLHQMLLSYPNDFRISREYILTRSDGDGSEAIDAALDELEALGYIKKKPRKDPTTGLLITENVVYELPQVEVSENV